MLRGRNLVAIIRAQDRAIASIEAKALRNLRVAIRRAQLELRVELQRLYQRELLGTASLGAPIREAQARALLAQIDILSRSLPNGVAESVTRELVTASHRVGHANAERLLRAYGVGVAPELASVLPVDVLARATNAAARLVNHSRAIARASEQAVMRGIITGQSWSVTARELARQTSLNLYQAERIVRTESVEAADAARRAQYAEHDVNYVQRVAILDDRVCEYCAARAGRIYRVDEAPGALHPFCRCYNAPVKKEWIEAGLVDAAWVEEHARSVREESARTNNKVVRVNTRAPFERLNNTPAPTPVKVSEMQ